MSAINQRIKYEKTKDVNIHSGFAHYNIYVYYILSFGYLFKLFNQ